MYYRLDTIPVKRESALLTLIENKTTYTFDRCELSVFETHQKAENVDLVFNDFVLTSMLRGKKVMQLENKPKFDYFPGESVIVAPGEMMHIDFPEATANSPTQCIALEISKELIEATMELLNEHYPKIEGCGSWDVDRNTFHLINNHQLTDTINRMLRISQDEQSRTKDIIIDLTLKEMLVRLMQTQARKIFETNFKTLALNNPLANAVNYIKENIDKKLSIDLIAQKACMSRASFFKKFKETLGITPSQFIMQERLKYAKDLLMKPKFSITQACYHSGFENLSHFITVFKKEFGASPNQYKSSHLHNEV
jgi:AraC family transcriptional regulator